MFASTIAEIFIQEGEIRVELEIGLNDLPAFRNLMPDEIYQRLGNEARPYGERIGEFFARDLVLALPTGVRLPSASKRLALLWFRLAVSNLGGLPFFFLGGSCDLDDFPGFGMTTDRVLDALLAVG